MFIPTVQIFLYFFSAVHCTSRYTLSCFAGKSYQIYNSHSRKSLYFYQLNFQSDMEFYNNLLYNCKIPIE